VSVCHDTIDIVSVDTPEDIPDWVASFDRRFGLVVNLCRLRLRLLEDAIGAAAGGLVTFLAKFEYARLIRRCVDGRYNIQNR